MHHKIIWISHDFTYLLTMRSIDPTVKIGYLALSPVDNNMIKKVTALKNSSNTVFIGASFNKFNAKVINICKQRRINIFSWLATSREKMKEIDPYFTGALADGI